MREDRPDEALVALLRDAGRAHHDAFAHVNGADPAWARWYAAFMAPRLEAAGGATVEAAALAAALEAAAEAHKSDSPDADWPVFYAAWMQARWPWTVRAP